MRRWGGRSYCELGSGERMDANAFIGRGCSVIAQAARGEGREIELEKRERERERERDTSNVRGEPVTAYYHFIHDLFFSLELWLLPNLQCCCLAVP